MMISKTIPSMTTEQLWDGLGKAIVKTAQDLLIVAAYYTELQNRGENLVGMTNPMFRFLPTVSAGKLLPEVLMRYGSNEKILQSLSSLVHEDQRKLAAPDAKVKLKTIDGRIVELDPAGLTQLQRSQVFHEGRILEPGEQHPIPPKPARIPATKPLADDYDMLSVLSGHQRARAAKMAAERDVSPATLMLRFLESKGFFALRLDEGRAKR